MNAAVSLISLLLIIGTFVPAVARASVLSVILASIKSNTASADTIVSSGNVQTMALLQPATNINPAPVLADADINIVDGSALVPEEGPAGTIADIVKPKNGTISTYVVKPGDTLSTIAKLYGVSTNTILWANDISKASSIHVGQTLTILPITSIKYTVKKGDTVASIAKRYSADATDIQNYNGIDDSTLEVGAVILIPGGELTAPAATVKKTTVKAKITVGAEPAHDVGPSGTATQIGYYASPLSHYIETQGIHGYNGVDLAAPNGTPIMASADGSVVVSRNSGYNGGYGSYVVIAHDNGSQTLYAHMSKVAVSVGATVTQGQVIGYVGSTGKSTGSHVHFEIRNGIKNPF